MKTGGLAGFVYKYTMNIVFYFWRCTNLESTYNIAVNETIAIFSEKLQKPITITRIEQNVITQWLLWKTADNAEQRQKPNGGYGWAKLREKYYHKKPYYFAPERRIDIAIWCGGQLCGLALGGVSKQYDHVALDCVEGSPVRTHPLKGHVLDIILFIVTQYAMIQDIDEVRLVDPVNNLISHYQSMGFELVSVGKKQKPYCSRNVHQ